MSEVASSPVNAEKLLRMIRKEFPEIRWRKHRFIEKGWDYHVVILDNSVVFRSPKRSSRSRNELHDEVRLLKYLKNKVNIGIPDYIYVLKDGPAAGYRLLSGQELKPSRFKRLSSLEKMLVAEQIASFLKVLHSTPKTFIKNAT